MLLIEDLLDSNEPSLSDKQQDALYVNFKMRYPHLKPSSDEFMAIYRTDPFVNALRVKYGYAVTCRKAQGGEWPTVFVDYSRGGSQYTEDYFRWAYTATTRARKAFMRSTLRIRQYLQPAKPIIVDIKACLANVIVVPSTTEGSPVEAIVRSGLSTLTCLSTK